MKTPAPKPEKIIAVVGPTASGKSSLAVALAEQFDGEVISADSRQIYRRLDIGTEKISTSEMRSVPHHLIDIREPNGHYSAADFVADADRAIREIAARGKLPIVAGGTLFYVEALIGSVPLAQVVPDHALRTQLEKLPTEALFEQLAVLDSARAATIDRHNRRRLIRALEIVAAYGSVPTAPPTPRYDACLIGIDVPKEVLLERLHARLIATLDRGLIAETKQLLDSGVSKEWLYEIGLEYRVILDYLDGKTGVSNLTAVLVQKLWQYAKRQRTWLKRMQNVTWIPYDAPESAAESIRDFLNG